MNTKFQNKEITFNIVAFFIAAVGAFGYIQKGWDGLPTLLVVILLIWAALFVIFNKDERELLVNKGRTPTKQTKTLAKKVITKTTVDGVETITETITEEEVEVETKKEVKGVHIGWWIFWLIVFFPALIVVAVVHFNKLRNN